MPASVTDATFQKDVLQSKIPVLVDFWAPWCGPCKAMNPIIEELDQEYAGKVRVVKVNVDENGTVPGEYNVMSIPTFILFKDGAIAQSFVGARSKADMKREIDKVIA